MGPKPKCIVYAAEKAGATLSDADLTTMASQIPLASSCLTCPLRAQNKLSDYCHLDQSDL